MSDLKVSIESIPFHSDDNIEEDRKDLGSRMVEDNPIQRETAAQDLGYSNIG